MRMLLLPYEKELRWSFCALCPPAGVIYLPANVMSERADRRFQFVSVPSVFGTDSHG